MMTYPARIVRDGKGYAVSFPDIPEALTCGDTREEAIAMAADALVTAMDFYFEDRRPVPLPSVPKRGQVLIELPLGIAAKVYLLNEMLAQSEKPSTLARKMGMRPQDMTRLLNLRHPTKIDTVSAAAAALGRKFDLRLL